MLRALAVPDIVGFVGLFCREALASISFLIASVTIFIKSSRVSGFFTSVPDILLPLGSLCTILYIRVSEDNGFLVNVIRNFSVYVGLLRFLLAQTEAIHR